jgi:molybdopterin-guanine dinucleotide biosynthesis protein A
MRELSGLILAGGRGARMGGADKGLVLHQGRPMAAWVAAALRPLVAEIVICANRNADQYAALGERVVGDALPDYQGPLAGLAAGLAAARGDWVLTAPCDMPLLTPAVFQTLLATQAAHGGATAVYARDGGDALPTLALLPRAALPGLQAALVAGERRLQAWLQGLNPVAADCGALHPQLINCNLPQADC